LGRLPTHALAACIAIPEGSPMRCPCCKADNPEGMKFCIECAAPLTRRCPQCGVANPPQAKFCGQCATSLTGQLLTLDETLQDTIPALLALLDVLPGDHVFLTLDPPQRRQLTLAALKRVLLRGSQVQPLLMVFEDLHWIDAEPQALLDSSAPGGRGRTCQADGAGSQKGEHHVGTKA
jgi:Double zinc ribbon